MDTLVMAGTQRVLELRKAIGSLTTQKSKTEAALAIEIGKIQKATAARAALVVELTSADSATLAYLENEIGELEAQTTSSRRFVESYESGLQKFATEIATANNELARLESQIQASVRAAKLEAFNKSLQEHANRIADKIDDLREELATLNSDAKLGTDSFGHPAQVFCDQLFAEFNDRLATWQARGWQLSHGHLVNWQILVRPMTKGDL